MYQRGEAPSAEVCRATTISAKTTGSAITSFRGPAQGAGGACPGPLRCTMRLNLGDTLILKNREIEFEVLSIDRYYKPIYT
jgi:hypothetical protein